LSYEYLAHSRSTCSPVL